MTATAPVTASTPTEHARRAPDSPAIVVEPSGETTTYAQLEDRSTRLARALRDRGVAEGSTIAVLMENNRQYLEVLWAAQRSGLHYTGINRHLGAAEVQHILDDSGAQALVTSPALAEVVRGLRLDGVPVRIAVGDGVAGFEAYDDVLAGSSPEPLEQEREGREMLYSSGTTGRPKGVKKPLPGTPFGDPSAAPVFVAQAFAGMLGVTAESVYLSPAPLYHAAPLVYTMAMHRLGATVVVMERFEPELALELIERHRVTHAQFVPTMFVRMLRLPEQERLRHDVSSLRFAVHAAAPCPVEVKRQMMDWWGPVLYEYYSGTEGVGSTYIGPEEWLAHPGSVGRPMDPCHIVGEDGQELPRGETGLVYFEGGMPFEYHNDPEGTRSVANAQGWRTLGDIGHLDEDGYLYLTDRKAHMIISGGLNIYPQEAENVLAAHPCVQDVAVIGVPHPEMGEEVKAVVQVADGVEAGPALAEELLACCRSALAGFKCPRSVDFVEDLPRDENGKLYKRRLREQYWSGRDSLIV